MAGAIRNNKDPFWSNGMRAMGFETLLGDNQSGPIIQTFLTPDDRQVSILTGSMRRCSAHGFAIYPGKLTKRRRAFRIGTIGKLDDAGVMRGVLAGDPAMC